MTVGGALSLQHIACSGNSCCAAGAQGGPTPPEPSLMVVDAVSGTPLCTANGVVQCNAPAAGACVVTCSDNAPQPCDQPQPGTYTMTVTVQTAAYKQGSVKFPVSIGACGLSPSSSAIAATLRLSPKCATTVTHDNGLGQRWTDCTPSGTYNEDEAVISCSYYPDANPHACGIAVTCDADAAVPTVAACSMDFGVGAEGPCDCWSFQGPGAGHVRASSLGCACASASDPTWH